MHQRAGQAGHFRAQAAPTIFEGGCEMQGISHCFTAFSVFCCKVHHLKNVTECLAL